MFLEETIVFLILISAITKLNVVSFLDAALVLLYLAWRGPRTFNAILLLKGFMFMSTLFLTLSNMTAAVNPMPCDLVTFGPDGAAAPKIPWIRRLEGQGTPAFTRWAYWLSLITTREKMKFQLVDLAIILLSHIYYDNCQFWALRHEIHVTLSHETLRELKRTMI
jgi:hypothetical protein